MRTKLAGLLVLVVLASVLIVLNALECDMLTRLDTVNVQMCNNKISIKSTIPRTNNITVTAERTEIIALLNILKCEAHVIPMRLTVFLNDRTWLNMEMSAEYTFNIKKIEFVNKFLIAQNDFVIILNKYFRQAHGQFTIP